MGHLSEFRAQGKGLVVVFPSASSRRARVGRVVDALGLRGPVFRWREWSAAWGRGGGPASETRVDEDGAAVPSAYLRTLVTGHPGLDWFLSSGRADADEFDALLRRHGGGFAEAASVLEWGCGAGRIARHVAPLPARFAGTDINARLLGWCARHLPGEYRRNRLRPPLPFPDDAFEVAYACSVLTHLREATAAAWLVEMARVLRPGGRAVLTFHDEQHPGAAPAAEALAAQGWAVRFDHLEGSNHLAAYVTAERLAAMAGPGLRLLEAVPSDVSATKQAVALFERV